MRRSSEAIFTLMWRQVCRWWVCNRPPTASARGEATIIKILDKLFHRTKEAKFPQIYILHSLFPFLPLYLLPLYPSPVPSQNIRFFPSPILPKVLSVHLAPSVSTVSVFVSPAPLCYNVPSPLPCLLATYSDSSLGPGTSTAVACPEPHVSCMAGWLAASQKNEQTSLSLHFPLLMHE